MENQEREETAKKGARIAVPNRAWARKRWRGLHHEYNILPSDKISCGGGRLTFFGIPIFSATVASAGIICLTMKLWQSSLKTSITSLVIQQ